MDKELKPELTWEDWCELYESHQKLLAVAVEAAKQLRAMGANRHAKVLQAAINRARGK